MSERARTTRVWVVLDRYEKGWVPLYQTAAPTRKQAIQKYENLAGVQWVTGGSYATDKKNGFVRCVAATLTLEQPKSKRKRP